MIYSYILKIVENDVKDTNLALLEQSREIVDEKFAEVDRVIVQLSMNQLISSLLRRTDSFSGDDYYTLWEIYNQILPYASSNEFMQYMFLYFKNTDIMLSPNFGSYFISAFYESSDVSKIYDYQKWSGFIHDESANKIVLPSSVYRISNEPKSMLMYICRLAVGNVNDVGKLVVFIDKSQIVRLLDKIELHGGGWITVSDAEGTTLLSEGNIPDEIAQLSMSDLYIKGEKGYFEQKIGDTELFITYTTSTQNNWMYTAAVPKKMIMEKVAYIRYVILTTAFLYIFSGLLIALILAYRNAKPVRRLVASIKTVFTEGQNQNKNEYEIIQSTVSQIISSNKQLQKTVESQRPLLRSAFIKKLLQGEFTNNDQLYAFMANAGLIISKGKFVVIIMHITGYGDIVDEGVIGELNKIHAIISTIDIDNHVASYDLNERDIVHILGYEANEPNESIEKKAETAVMKIYDHILNEYNIRCIFALGDVCTTHLNIYSSFNKAKITIESMMANGLMSKTGADADKIADVCLFSWYEGIQDLKMAYFYPSEIESRIRNLIKSGEILELEKVMQFIYFENFTARKLPKCNVDTFMGELLKTFQKAKSSLNIPDDYYESDFLTICKRANGKSDVFQQLKYMLKELCRKADEMRIEKSNELERRIIEYISSNHSDTNLSLQVIADKFGFNDVYMSHFFKKHIGENFSVYLEKVRIQKAVEMLKEQKHTIETISLNVGYNSAMSFRRAFKKVMGISPSEFKLITL